MKQLLVGREQQTYYGKVNPGSSDDESLEKEAKLHKERALARKQKVIWQSEWSIHQISTVAGSFEGERYAHSTRAQVFWIRLYTTEDIKSS